MSERMMIRSMPERPPNLTVIEACTLLNAIDAKERVGLAGSSFMAYAERGESIWLAGGPAEFVGVMGVGFVKLTKSTPHGQEVAVELLGPGQCFGLVAVIEARSYPLSAVAVTNSWYLKIPRNAFLELFAKHSALKDQVIRTIAPRIRKAHEMMTRLSSGRVEERLAAVLFMLASNYGRKDPRGLHISVPLTRQDLSEMAGTTVETTIRIMSRWQKEGAVETSRQRITILDEEALQDSFRAR